MKEAEIPTPSDVRRHRAMFHLGERVDKRVRPYDSRIREVLGLTERWRYTPPWSDVRILVNVSKTPFADIHRTGSLVLQDPVKTDSCFSRIRINMSQERATCWSLTINNPTSQDEEEIALARQKGWKVEGQLEKGEEGTPHYQLMVRTPQVRFSAVKKAFSRAHISVAREVSALKKYVHKQDTRIAELPESQEKYPSLSKFWDLIFDIFNERNWLNADQYPERLWRKETEDRSPLALFDTAVYNLICRGYHVESLAVNPNTRSMFKSYWGAIFTRCYIHRQADRQTNDAVESSVSIPTIEHNHADEDQREEGRLPQVGRIEAHNHEDYEEGSCSPNEGYSESTDSSTREEND